MGYQITLCPICATPYSDRLGDSCSGCGNNYGPVLAHKPLIKAVTLLIKRGIGVIDNDVRVCTSHKTKITIYLTGNIPEYLFDDLLGGWQIKHLNQLYCSEIDRSKMIKDLEEWCMSKDPDGFKSILKLSGYDAGR